MQFGSTQKMFGTMIHRMTIHSGICTYVPAYTCLPEHTLQAWTYQGAEQKRPDSADCDSAEQTPKRVLIDCSEYDADKHLKHRRDSNKPFLVWWICIIDCPMLVFATQSWLMLHDKFETPLPSPTPVQCIPLSLCKPWPCWNTSSTPSQDMDFWQSKHSCCHMPVNAVARKCKHNKCTCSECKISKQSSCKDCLSKNSKSPNFNCKDAFDTKSFKVQNSKTEFLQRLHVQKTASPQCFRHRFWKLT